nr:monoglyceride lipase-like [Tanacetum cinerariifolium]
MKGDEIMLTSGASGRVTALFSIQVLKSLFMLVNAFFLLLFYPFRGRKNEKVVRVPSGIVTWKSSANAGGNVGVTLVDHEVAVRRALAIRKVTDGGEFSRREYLLFVTPRGETMFTQSWTSKKVKTRALVVLLHGLNEHSGRYDEFAKQLNEHGYKVYGMDWVGHGGSDGLHAYVHSLDDAVTDAKAFIRHVLAENPGLPCFCFGHSTGGAIILKAALDPKIEKSIAGVVATSPAVGVQPSHPIFLILAPVLSLLLPKFQLSAANKKGTPVSRDPAALIAKYSDPLVYTGSIRGCSSNGNEKMDTTDVGVFGVSGNAPDVNGTANSANAVPKRQRVDSLMTHFQLTYLVVVTCTPLKYRQKRNLESRSAGSSNEMGGIETGVSAVTANDDDVAEATYSANASSKRQRVRSRPYNVESSSSSSRPPYIGDNSS